MITTKRIIVDNYNLHIVFGHTKAEWVEEFNDAEEEELWSFPIEELLDCSIDINEDIWYWCIDGRLYETTMEA